MGHDEPGRDRHDVRPGRCGFRSLSYGCVVLRTANTNTGTNTNTNTGSDTDPNTGSDTDPDAGSDTDTNSGGDAYSNSNPHSTTDWRKRQLCYR